MTRALMIAAPRSGSGKTTVTLGLLRAFRRRGVDVVGLKSGPDYIDPAFHAAASGREGSISIPGPWPETSGPRRRPGGGPKPSPGWNMIDDIELARALHVLFVVHWIGGVAFVTLVALPLAMASRNANEGWALFEAVENRFAAQARWSIPLAGAAGFWMVWRLGLWGVLADGSLWWLDAMAALWALFMAAVFIVEPLAHARIAEMAERDPSALLRRLWRAHLVLLAAASVTIVGAVAGAHGGLLG